MKILVHLTPDVIQVPLHHPDPSSGAMVTFSGVVRNHEGTENVISLFYEIYQPMAQKMIAEILQDLSMQYPCHSAEVIHRFGHIPAGETSLWIRVLARHRAEAFQLMTHLIDRLKKDVPIWKTQP